MIATDLIQMSSYVKENYWISELTDSGKSIGDSGIAVDLSFIYATVEEDTDDLVHLVTFDYDGTVQVTKEVDFTGTTITAKGSYIVPDSSGNIYMSACGTDTNLYAYLEKLTSAGAHSAGKQIGAGASDDHYAASIAIDSSDNIHIACQYNNGSTYRTQVIKYNSAGTEQWETDLYDATDGLRIVDICVDSSGNVYVVGYLDATQDLGLLIKLNSSGTVQWQREFTVGVTSCQGTGVDVDSSGNVYAAYSVDANAYVVKYNSSGALQWQRRLVTSTGGIDVAIAVSSGNIIAVRSTYVWCYNLSGTIQWQRTLVGDGSNRTATSRMTSVAAIAGKPGFVVSGYIDTTYGFVAKLPINGTLTGTHGFYVYSASAVTEAAGSGTDAAGGTSSTTKSQTESSDTPSVAASSISDSKTSVT